MFNQNNLIWIDLEMTGLNPNKHSIIEIATIVTNSHLKILEKGPELAIFQDKNILSNMNLWSKKIHQKNGLIEKVKNSKNTNNSAERDTISFLEKWVPKNCSPMCGNSVQNDRIFLLKYMPKLESYFHYRIIDVSTIKELVKRWNPKILKKFKKNNNHRALEDVYSSIYELSFYKDYFLKI